MNLLPQLGSPWTPWTTFKGGMKVAFGIRSNSSSSIILFVAFFEKASCKTPCEHPRVLHSKEEGKSFSADNRNSQWGSCFFAVASSSTFFYSNAFFESTNDDDEAASICKATFWSCFLFSKGRKKYPIFYFFELSVIKRCTEYIFSLVL